MKTLSVFVMLLLLNSVFLSVTDSDKKKKKDIKQKSSKANLKSSLQVQGADKFHPEIDGLGTIAKGGKIEINGESVPLVLDKPPFKVKSCNQIIATNAEYIEDLKDFRKRKEGFFIITVLSIHLFQAKDATKLIHSSNFTQIEKLTQPLKGARGCLVVDGGKSTADITVCFKNEADTQALLDAIKSFGKCRMGDSLVPISEDKIKKLAAACGAKEEAVTAENFEMSVDIRSGNKWDSDRAKFFQPKQIQVPGTPPIVVDDPLKKK